MSFANRNAAGRLLARALRPHIGHRDGTLVLGIARGGITVATQVSAALHLPLDVVVARDIGVALVVEGGLAELDDERASEVELEPSELDALVTDTRTQIMHDVLVLRGHRPFPPLWQRVVILVDDGGSSQCLLDGVIRLLRARGAGRVILAAPVANETWIDGVAGIVDQLVCLDTSDRAEGIYLEDEPLRDVDLAVQLMRARLAA